MLRSLLRHHAWIETPSSALVALALALGLRGWVYRPRVRLVLRPARGSEEMSDRVVTKRLVTAELRSFVTRSFVTLSFDWRWPAPESVGIWDHFCVYGPIPENLPPPVEAAR